MLSSKTLIKLSKDIEHILKNESNKDRFGFALLEKVYERLQTNYNWIDITLSEMIETVNSNTVKRLEILGNQIRLNESSMINLPYNATKILPPPVLYYGTTATNLIHIKKHGIKSIKNDKLKLFTQKEMINVLSHKNSCIVYIQINSLKAHNEGIQFYKYRPYCYLADYIPLKYINKFI